MMNDVSTPTEMNYASIAPSFGGMNTDSPVVAITADNQALLYGLKMYVQQSRFGVKTISSLVGDVHTAIDQLQPEILVMEISTHSMDGMKMISSLRSSYPSLHILVLAEYTMQSLVNMVFRAGATGYLLSVPEQAVMIAALEAIAQGNIVLDKQLGYMRSALSSVLTSSCVLV